jgi:ADP-heptose:LPS heptosyltransferase/GT2 family glycosyltransferase
MSPSATLPAPRSILLLKPDTLGDLVLFTPALAALRTAWPTTEISVVIRRAYADIAPYLTAGVKWVETSLDPFSSGPGQNAAELIRLQKLVTDLAPTIVVGASSRRNWLETALAKAAPTASRRVALGAAAEDPYFGAQTRSLAGIDAELVFTEHVPTPEAEPDWQRNCRLAEALVGRTLPHQPPRVTAPTADPIRTTVAAVHSALGLKRGEYLACGAAGFANVQLKTWSAEKFGVALRHVRERHGLPALLLGHESERTHLELVSAAAGGVPIWVGRDGELPVLAGLLADAKLYFGNDTGAMHLAAALDVPVVAVFGGGTWPRFVPTARRGVAVVQPLPCFACGWDCAFGDAPCLNRITAADAIGAIDAILAARDEKGTEIHRIERLSAEARELMGLAAAQYRSLRSEHHARQAEFERTVALAGAKDVEIVALKAAADEKDREIAAVKAAADERQSEIRSLKSVCDERERLIKSLHHEAGGMRTELATTRADAAELQAALAKLPADSATTVRALVDHAIHSRNLQALLHQREHELAELKASTRNTAAGLHDLEQAKHYGKLLAEKEAVIQSLHRACEEREAVIKQLAAQTTGITARLHKMWIAARGHLREKWWRPFDAWLFDRVVTNYWMQIGVLRHYDPRPLQWDARIPAGGQSDPALPHVAIVTPSYGQERFVERTMRSVLNQAYPKLHYVVQDGGSKDGSAGIIARHAERLHHWESVRDEGQADAIRRGFSHVVSALGPTDLMAWLNSDDLLGPGVLQFVAGYFARHPDVDVVYGHRIIIDDEDRDVGRWIMPPHNPATLEWIDYVPQETLFWRKRAWDLVGGIDPSFQFALDWDLLARFQQAGCKIVRLPYFLGAFRVHAEQKTSQAIHTTGAEEMRRIRTRFHGERQDDPATISEHARQARFWGAVIARLHAIGVRW